MGKKKNTKPLAIVENYVDTNYTFQDLRNQKLRKRSFELFGFDIGASYLSCWLSNYAYFKKPPENRLALMGAHGHKILFDKKTSTEVLVVWDDYSCFWAFRGSMEKKDWLYNLLFIKKKTRFGRTSIGTTKSVESVEGELFDLIEEYSLRDHRHIVTGHSRGGGCGSIFAPRLSEKVNHRVCGYFHAPLKVGGAGFRRTYKKKTLDETCVCIINNNDTVPRKPYKMTFTWTFFHCAPIVLIDVNKELTYKPKKIKMFRDRFRGAREDAFNGECDFVHDHFITEYIIGEGKNLHKLLNEKK